jgi:hypothetical protein
VSRRVVTLRRILLGAAAALLAPTSVGAQEGCRYADDGNDELLSSATPGGERITYIRRPHFLCADGVEIWADSAVAYSDQAMSQLFGRVRYRDRARELRSDQARYFSNVGRLQAQGNLHVTNLEDGSVIENGDLVYLREADYREVEEMVVTIGADGLRPRALVHPAPPDSAAPSAESPAPYSVVSDRLVLRGAGYFNATGTVEIERDSLFAFADSAEFDDTAELLYLVGNARVASRSYDLVGRSITLGTADTGPSEIRAVREAILTGEDLVIRAPLISLFVLNGAMERLVAVPLRDALESDPLGPAEDSASLARPVAVAENLELTADSIEVVAPAEVVERIFAAGTARSVSHARDSLNVEELLPVARSDWLEGDTVIVSLRRVVVDSAAPDTVASGEYQVERIVAKQRASSLYRLPPEDSTAVLGIDPPAVHYVRGDEITIVMREGEVESMNVVGQAQGVHYEPQRRPTAPADSLAVPPADFPPDSTTMTLERRDPPNEPLPSRPDGNRPAQGAQPWTRQ